jgi:hypothetical protein
MLLMLSLVGFFIIALLPVSVIVIFLDWIQVRRARRKSKQSFCAGCHYQLGGWPSSVCPECGSDVHKVGVRISTGPRPFRFIGCTSVGSLVLIFTFPLVNTGVFWVSAQKRLSGHSSIQSTTLEDFYGGLEIQSYWRRFPPAADYKSALILNYFETPPAGSWINARYTGSTPNREVELKYDDTTGPPSLERIEAATAQVLGDGVEQATIDAHAQALHDLVTTVVREQSTGQLNGNDLIGWSYQPLRAYGGGAGIGSPSLAPSSHIVVIVGLLVTLGLTIIVVWLALKLLWRLMPTNRRQVQEGEWTLTH